MNTPLKPHQLQILEQPSDRSVPSLQSAQVGKHIKFDTKIWDSFAKEGCQKVHYDLLLLCAAIEIADRKWKRPKGWSRAMHLTVPVLAFDIWQRPDVKRALKAVLDYLTCDSWNFEFIEAKEQNPCKFKQGYLWYGGPETFVFAYSEGLDSRAVGGLEEQFAHGSYLRVAKTHSRRSALEPYFTEIPFNVANTTSNESSFRSRGFQFAAVTAIAAHMRNLSRIVVPESGQGALGPAMLPLHMLYPDYRNHPSFFRRMEIFVQTLLNHQVKYEQPRLWSTKGQTLTEFAALSPNNKYSLLNTKSCWQKRHIVNIDRTTKQCGLCAACLLRRMSLHSAGINEDPSGYVIYDLGTSDLKKAMKDIRTQNARDNMIEYGLAGVRHFQHFADFAAHTEEDLRVHIFDIAEATGLSQEIVYRNLKALFKSHAQEWQAFIAAQGASSFLRDWLVGDI